jgi:hypothetical protein
MLIRISDNVPAERALEIGYGRGVAAFDVFSQGSFSLFPNQMLNVESVCFSLSLSLSLAFALVQCVFSQSPMAILGCPQFKELFV